MVCDIMTLGLPQMDHFPGAPSALGVPAPTDSSRNARNTRTAESFRIRLDLPAVFSVPLNMAIEKMTTEIGEAIIKPWTLEILDF